MSKALKIRKLSRRLRESGLEETLTFADGVNVIAGAHNTGKSTWLRMFDFLMGETESALQRFDDTIVKKYDLVSVELECGTEKTSISREWSADGRRSTATLDGHSIQISQIQEVMLDKLDIPLLRFPQGNVFATDRTWPTLGWRTLLRHIYRRQEFWGDLVPKQPESEQNAALLQFLGLAEHLFSDDLAAYVDKQREISKLQQRKDAFVQILNEIAPDLVGDAGVTVALTPQSVDDAMDVVLADIEILLAHRKQLLEQLRDGQRSEGGELDLLINERHDWAQMQGSTVEALSGLADRLSEVHRYQASLRQELDRLGRADAAASAFAGVRITHCPACDRAVEFSAGDDQSCILCHRPESSGPDSDKHAEQRLAFERARIKAESEEAKDLADSLEAERKAKGIERDLVQRKLREIDARLLPLQTLIAPLIPEELPLIDQRIGALNARMEALRALLNPLSTRDRLGAEIQALENEASELDRSVSGKEEIADFETASDRLEDGFNTYLNAIRAADPASWTKSGAVAVRVGERKTSYSIAGRPAKSQLGGTLTIFFLFAYHYALLSLTRFDDTHFPGLAVLDLFADIARAEVTTDRLALVLDPFVKLAAADHMPSIQVIATSRDFANRDGVNIVRLTHPWK